MVSLSTSPNCFLVSTHFAGILKFPVAPSLVFAVNRRTRRLQQRQAVYSGFLGGKDGCSLGFPELDRRKDGGSWCCFSCKGWDSDGDAALEAEIFEFMKQSQKPKSFPTKSELMDAGRVDLLNAIKNQGGWLSMGWESEDDNEPDEVTRFPTEAMDWDNALEEFQRRVESVQANNSSQEIEISCPVTPSSSTDSSRPGSLSDSSLEMESYDDPGIEGILTRLEKQRNLSLSLNLGDGHDNVHDLAMLDADDRHFASSNDADRADLGRNDMLASDSPREGLNNDSALKIGTSGSLSNLDSSGSSIKPETWRTWSTQRAGFSVSEFEAAEICFDENHMPREGHVSENEILVTKDNNAEPLDRPSEIDCNYIRSRLAAMKLELTSALRSLRSNREELMLKLDHDNSPDDLQKLSDALEFQENEFMTAQIRLRSLRAKISVLEGKMAMAIINAQKMLDDKQKRINYARSALQLLHTACIVWPNAASEVLLTGSFDGWTTQRKMEKTSGGVFTLYMKLYPGRYEIKFIVDGEWKIDPLRPIVRNNGYENNLLVITQT